MKQLTHGQIVVARTWLDGIQQIHALMKERVARGHEPFDSDEEAVAYLTVTKTMQNIEGKLVETLAAELGVDLDAPDKLAEVIDILDGNRRKARLR